MACPALAANLHRMDLVYDREDILDRLEERYRTERIRDRVENEMAERAMVANSSAYEEMKREEMKRVKPIPPIMRIPDQKDMDERY